MSKEQREELELELEQAEAEMKKEHHNSLAYKEAKSNAETLRKLIDELPEDKPEGTEESETASADDANHADTDEQVADANEEAEAIIAGAKAEAERIVSDAVEEAERMKSQAADAVIEMIGNANEDVKKIHDSVKHTVGSVKTSDKENKPKLVKQASIGDCIAMERKQRQKAIDEKAEAEDK